MLLYVLGSVATSLRSCHFTAVLSVCYILGSIVTSLRSGRFVTIWSKPYHSALVALLHLVVPLRSGRFDRYHLVKTWSLCSGRFTTSGRSATIWSLRDHLVKTWSLQSGRVATSGRSATIWSLRYVSRHITESCPCPKFSLYTQL